jgi:hypothetical protein
MSALRGYLLEKTVQSQAGVCLQVSLSIRVSS